MKNAVARLKKIKFKENVLKAEVVEDSEEHKNTAKPEVVETLETQTPLKKKMKMRWPGLRKNSKKNAVKAEVVEDSEEHKNAAKSVVVETLETPPH